MLRSATTNPGANGITANEMQRSSHNDGGCEDEDRFVGEGRNPVFLHEELDRVGERSVPRPNGPTRLGP